MVRCEGKLILEPCNGGSRPWRKALDRVSWQELERIKNEERRRKNEAEQTAAPISPED